MAGASRGSRGSRFAQCRAQSRRSQTRVAILENVHFACTSVVDETGLAGGPSRNEFLENVGFRVCKKTCSLNSRSDSLLLNHDLSAYGL